MFEMTHKKCPLDCDSLYKNQSNFVLHLKRKHFRHFRSQTVSPLSSSEIKKIEEIKELWKKSPLVNIIKKTKKNAKTCDLCGAEFGLLKNLRAHILKGHKKNPEKCVYSKCASYHLHKNNYMVHLKERHVNDCCMNLNEKERMERMCKKCKNEIQTAVKKWSKKKSTNAIAAKDPIDATNVKPDKHYRQ